MYILFGNRNAKVDQYEGGIVFIIKFHSFSSYLYIALFPFLSM